MVNRHWRNPRCTNGAAISDLAKASADALRLTRDWSSEGTLRSETNRYSLIMAVSRRSFLKATGALLATPAIIRGQVDALLTQTPQINMEIKRVGSQPSEQRTGRLVYRHGTH